MTICTYIVRTPAWEASAYPLPTTPERNFGKDFNAKIGP